MKFVKAAKNGSLTLSGNNAAIECNYLLRLKRKEIFKNKVLGTSLF